MLRYNSFTYWNISQRRNICTTSVTDGGSIYSILPWTCKTGNIPLFLLLSFYLLHLCKLSSERNEMVWWDRRKQWIVAFAYANNANSGLACHDEAELIALIQNSFCQWETCCTITCGDHLSAYCLDQADLTQLFLVISSFFCLIIKPFREHFQYFYLRKSVPL